ncbi:family 20 glycosylhydrolase [Candidatus Phyllobacterium onerii]|uniref:family 20 glycosylhydrolase n=1 Tax=Candidatus Phyllobacterium onerii TaxID=3020828 RepID=UPI00232F6C60|nr:family 20 glycosylhydrolase [Phyllobacterium sp. IY22]
MRQMFLATTALSLSLALAACNDDKGGTDNTSTFNGMNQKIAALDSAQQQNKATIDDQNKEIASLKQARADDTAAFETRLAAVVKTIDERPDISPELEKRLVALKEQIGKIPAFSTAEEFEAFKQELKDLRTELDKAPKTAKVAELSDSLAALSDKFASATDFREVKDYVGGVKAKLEALLAAADPELLKTLKDTLAGLRTDLTGKTTFTDEDIKGFTDRIAALEKLIETKADIAMVPALATAKFACTTDEKSDILTSTPASMLDKNKAPAVVPGVAKWQGGMDNLTLTAKSRINIEPANAKALQPLADRLVTDLAEITGLTLPVVTEPLVRDGDIALSLSPCNEAVKTKIGNEGYTLNIGKAAILRGNIAKGVRVDEDKRDYTDSVFYASRTLLQMLMLDGRPAKAHAEVKQGYTVDIPRFAHRRLMFDVGRKYAGLDFLKNYIRFMGWYKMNTLHLHLNDHNKNKSGTQSAAFRLKCDNSVFAKLYPVGEATYSRNDWDELEAIAADNGVRIVPEIDTPGHSIIFARDRTDLAVKDTNGNEMIDPRKPETLVYIQSVFNEFMPWFRSNRIHIGGDEVWINGLGSAAIAYLNKLGEFLISKGKTVEIWGDQAYLPDQDKRFFVTRWANSEKGPSWKERGYDWIEGMDGIHYIVPSLTEVDWFNPLGLKGEKIYDFWSNTYPTDNAFGPIGGQLSVWNDKAWERDYTWEVLANNLLKDGIPAGGQVWWRGQIKDGDGKLVPYSEIRKSVGVLQYGPGVTLFANSPIEGDPKPATTASIDVKPACVPTAKRTCP